MSKQIEIPTDHVLVEALQGYYSHNGDYYSTKPLNSDGKEGYQKCVVLNVGIPQRFFSYPPRPFKDETVPLVRLECLPCLVTQRLREVRKEIGADKALVAHLVGTPESRGDQAVELYDPNSRDGLKTCYLIHVRYISRIEEAIIW